MTMVDADELVTLSDIAMMLVTQQSAVSNWLKRHDDFPEPVVVVGQRTQLFLRRDVLRWYRQKYPERVEGLRRLHEQMAEDLGS